MGKQVSSSPGLSKARTALGEDNGPSDSKVTELHRNSYTATLGDINTGWTNGWCTPLLLTVPQDSESSSLHCTLEASKKKKKKSRMIVSIVRRLNGEKATAF